MIPLPDPCLAIAFISVNSLGLISGRVPVSIDQPAPEQRLCFNNAERVTAALLQVGDNPERRK